MIKSARPSSTAKSGLVNVTCCFIFMGQRVALGWLVVNCIVILSQRYFF